MPDTPDTPDERLLAHLRGLGIVFGPLAVATAAAGLTDFYALRRATYDPLREVWAPIRYDD